jgi:Ribonuclease G/E
VSKFSTTIIIDSGPGETRGALLRAGVVWDVVHHRNAEPSLVGAIYRGRVRKVDHGLNGAFVEIGQGPQAYLRARDGSDPADKTPRKVRRSMCASSPTGSPTRGRVFRVSRRTRPMRIDLRPTVCSRRRLRLILFSSAS